MKGKIKIFLAVALVGMLMGGVIGCATVAQTPKEKYVSTFATWNDLLESYTYQYNQADPETQAVWKEKIDPIIIEANAAMLAWGTAIEEGTEPEQKAEIFIALERQVMQLLLKYGITIRR